jgi:hypothetical protein
MPGRVTQAEELAGVVAGAVGVPDQDEHERVVQGLRQRAACFLAQSAGQLLPAVRRRVELGAGEVADRGAGIASGRS